MTKIYIYYKIMKILIKIWIILEYYSMIDLDYKKEDYGDEIC